MMQSHVVRAVVLMVFCLSVLALPPVCQAQSDKTVLLLNSYSYDMKWTRSITEAVSHAFVDVPNVNLVVEFMDTKRHRSQGYFDNLLNLYSGKYANTTFDVVITSDDNAVNFALKHRESLFPDAPIIFCGVNNIALPEREDFQNITGALEVPDVTGTLELIATNHPDLLELYIVNESYTVTSSKDRMALQKQLDQFNKMFKSVWLEDLTDDELREALANLNPYSAVLLLSFFPDKKSNTFKIEDGAHFVSSASSRPVYSMWEYFLGEGIVGGKLTSGTYQGKKAAQMALEVLSGNSPEAIPVVSMAANQVMFDHQQMERFGIDGHTLPDGAVVINKPATRLQRFRTQLTVALMVIATLAVLCVVLVNNIRARRQAESSLEEANHDLQKVVSAREHEIDQIKRTDQALKESQEAVERANKALRLNMAHLRTLVESIPDLVWFKDVQGVYQFCNQRFERFFGASEPEIVGKVDYDFLDKKVADSFRKYDNEAMKAGRSLVYEETVTYKDDGHTEDLETIKTPIYDDQGGLVGVLGVARDITRRKLFTDELKERELRFKALHDAAFGAIVFHENGKILDCNQGVADLMGYATSELVGMELSGLIAEASRGQTVESILSGTERSIKTHGLHKSGEVFDMRLETMLIPYEGKKVGVIEFRNISSASCLNQVGI